jgi:hypothetical protein
MASLLVGPQEPVPAFPIRFQWHEGDWFELFEKHIAFIRKDIRRARFADRFVVYLSCPISGYAGSFAATNVDIAAFTARRLSADWGNRFWFLNPAQYQMESQAGLGLIRDHAREILLEKGRTIDVDALLNDHDDPVQGGDYMRMWTRILVEDEHRAGHELGEYFDAYYFLGQDDIHRFFSDVDQSADLATSIEGYLSRKIATDSEFRKHFTPPFTNESGKAVAKKDEEDEWKRRRSAFFRYYMIRGGANYSRGSHDEWNILRALNERRRSALGNRGLGSQIAAYYSGGPLSPTSLEQRVSPGYEVLDRLPGR